MYPIEVVSEENDKIEVFISNIPEEDFEEFGLEWSAYHEQPNEYFDLLKHNWHTKRTMFLTYLVIILLSKKQKEHKYE